MCGMVRQKGDAMRVILVLLLTAGLVVECLASDVVSVQPPPGTFRKVGDNEHFQFSLWKDHRADISTLKHDASTGTHLTL